MTNLTAIRLGLRIKRARKQFPMSQAELARRAFVSRSYIAHLETGRNMPSWEVLEHIAEALGIPEGSLLTDEAPERLTPEQQAVALMQQSAAAISGVPIRFWGRVPANQPRPVDDVGDGRHVSVPAEWVGGRSIDDLFVVRASGDCMLRRGITDGSYVLCEMAYGREPRNGQLVALWVDGERSLKLWHRTGDDIELRDGEDRIVAHYTIRDDIVVVGFWVADWRTADDIAPTD